MTTPDLNGIVVDDNRAAAAGDTPVLAEHLLTRSQIRNLPQPTPLIDNVLDHGTFALMYGKWGTGKSFIALDQAACVATGRRWQGRDTEQQRVLYVAAEGAFGLQARLDAWETGWKVAISDRDLHIMPKPINLFRPIDAGNLASLIDWNGYGFVVIDTLSRSMVGADENSAKDCGLIVDVLHQLRERTPGGRGVVLALHHSGKDGKTFRGSSVFEAGADTVYSVNLDGSHIVLDREKRKDGPQADNHHLKLASVEGTNSMVVDVSREGGTNTARADKLLSHFVSHFGDRGAFNSQLFEGCEMLKSTFYRAVNDLQQRGDIVNEGSESRPFWKVVAK